MAEQRVELRIEGMTCASCAARVETRLDELEHVSATVNLATERATVAFGDDVAVDDLLEAVASTGYRAAPVHSEHGGHDEHDHGDPSLRRRLLLSALLALPIVLVGMIPALQFRD